MTGFDIAVLILVGLGAVTGFLRGFVQEILALAAWVISLFAIHNMHTPLSAALVPYVGSESGATVLAFALLLLIPALIGQGALKHARVPAGAQLRPVQQQQGDRGGHCG